MRVEPVYSVRTGRSVPRWDVPTNPSMGQVVMLAVEGPEPHTTGKEIAVSRISIIRLSATVFFKVVARKGFEFIRSGGKQANKTRR